MRSSPVVEPSTHRLLLILADISGYTEFMLANQLTLVHGQQLITNAIEAIIAEIEIPLELKEIEGDAVFLYAVHPEDEASWREVCDQVSRKLFAFFEAFSRSIVASAESTVCVCGTCRNADKLKLKIVVHSGEALFHAIDRFRDVSGVDVILAHRLLKNSVASDEYLLLTDAARRELSFPDDVHFEASKESYAGFGTFDTFVHYPADPRGEARRKFHTGSAAAVTARAVARNFREVLAMAPAAWHSGALAERNGARTSSLRPLATAVFLAIWTPVELLIVALLTPVRIARRRRELADPDR
jgi:hypothetical protein